MILYVLYVIGDKLNINHFSSPYILSFLPLLFLLFLRPPISNTLIIQVGFPCLSIKSFEKQEQKPLAVAPTKIILSKLWLYDVIFIDCVPFKANFSKDGQCYGNFFLFLVSGFEKSDFDDQLVGRDGKWKLLLHVMFCFSKYIVYYTLLFKVDFYVQAAVVRLYSIGLYLEMFCPGNLV